MNALLHQTDHVPIAAPARAADRAHRYAVNIEQHRRRVFWVNQVVRVAENRIVPVPDAGLAKLEFDDLGHGAR